MTDKWSELADMLANLIEKYASDINIENLSDITVDNHAEDEGNETRKERTRKEMREAHCEETDKVL